MRIASFRMHWNHINHFEPGEADQMVAWDLFGHVWTQDVADAVYNAFTREDWTGHQTFFLCAADTKVKTPSLDLVARWFPNVPLREGWFTPEEPRKGFYDCSKAARMLGFKSRGFEQGRLSDV
jgi:hypothetical protein